MDPATHITEYGGGIFLNCDGCKVYNMDINMASFWSPVISVSG